MHRSIHACRALPAVLLLVSLGLTGGAAGAAADTGAPAPTPSTTDTTRQWAITPDKGPAAGGTTVTLTPPAADKHYTQISAGDGHSMAIGSDGNLYTWGYNSDSQLGRDTGGADHDATPGMMAKPAGVDKWTQISASENHSMAVGSDGNIYTWGSNEYGLLGRDTGGADRDATPGMVDKPAGVDKWVQISAGRDHTMALGSDGNIYTWGNFQFGQLGRDDDPIPDDRPGMVDKPAGVDRWVQISAGYQHSMALGSDGNVYTWGDNYYRQLGRDYTPERTDRPGMVAKPAGVDKWTQIGAGDGYSMALGSDGDLYTWGNNQIGQLGRDTDTTERDGNPAMVNKPAGIDKWTRAIAGDFHPMAIGSDGDLYTWGWNYYGQLGRPTDGTDRDATPGKVAKPAGIDKWTQISAGGDHSMAIGSDGNLYTWGNNEYGQLGRDTDTTDRDGNPGRVVLPYRVALTGVRFGQDAGTGLAANADGTWSVTTPAHAAGEVTVTVSWSLNGVAQPDQHLTYTYEAAPVVTRTVTFDPAGGTPVPTQQIADGQKALKPADPTRDGHRFDGWYNGTDAYDFNQPVTHDLTLTAHWTRTTNPRWTITPDKGSVTGGTKITLTLNGTEDDDTPATLTGVKFGQDAGTDLAANADGTWSVTTPAHEAGEVTVTVSWSLNGVAQPDQHLTYTYEAAPVVTRTVTFDPAGGTPVPAQQITDGQKALKPADPTRDGHRFDGWYNGTDAYDFDQPVTHDLTLTAHWTRTTTPAGPTPGTAKPTPGTARPAPGTTGDGPDPSDGALSNTGSDTTTILATAILALTTGATLLAGTTTRRRRETTHHTPTTK